MNDFLTLVEAKQGSRRILNGAKVALQDKTGRVRIGTVRIKKVRCGKSNCKKCPHERYAYAQFRVDDKVTEKYIGIAR